MEDTVKHDEQKPTKPPTTFQPKKTMRSVIFRDRLNDSDQ